MQTRAKKYTSIKTLFALLTANLLVLGKAEYVHRHRDGIQSKTYEHPRFGESSIRYCAFNQYFDDREGRCMIIPGGGIAISIDENTTCSTEALRGHLHRPRNYYVCRETSTILAECPRGKSFDNRLKRCAINTRSTDDEEDYDSHHHPYDHLHLPACQRSGRFPIPQDNCTSYYSCTSNGFRFFRTIHKCPASTGFDPSAETCTIERACADDETLESTTVTYDRTKIFGSTTSGLITVSGAGQPVDKASSIDTSMENYSVNTSTTKFSTITGSSLPSKSSASRYDGTITPVKFTPSDTFGTEKLTKFTGLPDSTDEVVGIESLSRSSTEVYEQVGITSPFTSTIYVRSFSESEQTDKSERSPITIAANEIVLTSTEKSVQADKESAVNTSGTIYGILYNTYSDDYVTLRTRDEIFTDTTVKISTDSKNDEFTDLTENEDSGTSKRDETRTSEANEVGIGLQVSGSTESAMDNSSEKWLFDKNIGVTTPTIANEITEGELSTPLTALLSSATSDAETRSITTPNGVSSIDKSSIFIDKSERQFTPGNTDDEKSTTAGVESAMSTIELAHISEITENFDSTSVSPTSLTNRKEKATSIQESNWTTEETSTTADRDHDTSSSFSTDKPDNEETVSGIESVMSTIEPAHISEVTENFDSTFVSPTSLTNPNEEATSIQESNWTTEEISTTADRDHDTSSSSSTDKPDNEETVSGMESIMSTIGLAHISEVTENFDSTFVSPTSLTNRNEEATNIQESNWTTEEKPTTADRDLDTSSSFSTDKPDNEETVSGIEAVMSTIGLARISEVTENFDSTSVSPTSLTNRNEEATSIQESNWTTEEKPTTADRDLDTSSSFSTDKPDNEETLSGIESVMSTIGLARISEVTENFDSTSVSPTSLTNRNEEATSIQESNWTIEEKSTTADTDRDTLTSFSTDTLDNEKSTTPGVKSAMSTTEPAYMSEVTEKTVTYLGIIWNSSSTDDPFTSVAQHHEITGQESVSLPSAMSDATTRDIHNTEVQSTTTPSGISSIFIEKSKIISTPGRSTLYDVVTLTTPVYSYASDSGLTQKSLFDNEKSATTQEINHSEESIAVGPESAMSTAEPANISESTEKAVTNSEIIWKSSSSDDLFTSSEEHQGITGEKSYPEFKYTSSAGVSPLTIVQITEDSDPKMNLSTTSIIVTPSVTSEPSQLAEDRVQSSYTISSESRNSEYPTTVESSTGSTNSSSTPIPFSD